MQTCIPILIWDGINQTAISKKPLTPFSAFNVKETPTSCGPWAPEAAIFGVILGAHKHFLSLCATIHFHVEPIFLPLLSRSRPKTAVWPFTDGSIVGFFSFYCHPLSCPYGETPRLLGSRAGGSFHQSRPRQLTLSPRSFIQTFLPLFNCDAETGDGLEVDWSAQQCIKPYYVCTVSSQSNTHSVKHEQTWKAVVCWKCVCLYVCVCVCVCGQWRRRRSFRR